MIIDYDHNQNLNTDRKLDSLKESVQMALNENDAEHKGFRGLFDKVNASIDAIKESIAIILGRVNYSIQSYTVSNISISAGGTAWPTMTIPTSITDNYKPICLSGFYATGPTIPTVYAAYKHSTGVSVALKSNDTVARNNFSVTIYLLCVDK